MQEPPRSRATAGDTPSANPHRRYSSALARNSAGAWCPGDPRRSVDCSFQTPRDVRRGDRHGRPGTLPPVPGRPTFFPAAVVAVLLSLAFAALTWQVVARGPLWRWDRRVDAGVLRAAAHHRLLRPAAQLLADLGDPAVALPVLAVVLGCAAWCRRDVLPAAGYAVVMAVTGAVVVPVKEAVSRPAPGASALVGHSGYFPSGHAATAAAASGLAVLALLPLLRRAAARRLLVIAAVLLNLAVGAALVWRGYHWPLDVVAAWCLSGVLLVLAPGPTCRAGARVRGAGARLTSWWGTRG